MNAEYPTVLETEDDEQDQPQALYKLLDNGRLIFTGAGEYYYRQRLELLGINLDDINTLRRYEIVTRILDSIDIEQSKHKVVRSHEFLTRRTVMARERQDQATASRLSCLIHNV